MVYVGGVLVGVGGGRLDAMLRCLTCEEIRY